MTALHAAISKTNKQSDAVVALLLIEAGADVNLKDKVSRMHSMIREWRRNIAEFCSILLVLEGENACDGCC